MNHRTRRSAFIAALAIFTIALLLSLRWLADRPDGKDSPLPSTRETASAGIGTSGTRESSQESRQRRSNDHGDARINSLLDIRPGEIAMIRIPAEGLSNWSEGSNQENIPGSIQAMLSKAQTAALLKEIEGQGFRFAAQVGDQSHAEFGLSGSTVRVEIDEDHADYAVFRIQNFVNGSRTLRTSTTLFKGYATLLRPNGPDSDGLLLLTGSKAELPEP